ncbi:DUF2779 domain-containing protein [Mycoplasma zalophi]|uniref:DUF2779 domain-containing protein n=1 Tax=Mycoplasma zalophi TaxID=191287 RepID=A0ABS6DQD0_9MOLU|nr:DUF2779 domain-containing protein [Mycoplasma zalophi]MBU4692527.1 DUF2779 domain-containing protein [Mycoplasma zalophi]
MKINPERVAKFKNYFSANTSSDFWIKHSKDDYLNLKKIQQKDNLEEESSDDEDEFDYFSQVFDSLLENNELPKTEENNYFSVATNIMFKKINQKMIDIIEENYNPSEIFVVPITKSLEEKISLTESALSDPKIKLIRNPFFIHYIDSDNENILLANPAAYNKEKNILYSQNAVTSIKKLKYVLKAYWEAEILKRNDLKVDEYIFLILDRDINKKNEVHIKKQQEIAYAKTKKNGVNEERTFNINDLLNDGFIDITKANKQKTLEPLSLDQFSNLWLSLLVNSDSLDTYNESDNISDWGKNEHANLIFFTENPKFANINGTFLIKIKKFFFENKFDEIKKEEESKIELQYIFNKINSMNKERTQDIIENIQKEGSEVIWYDFEGFSLPFSPLDNVRPYTQVVNQVSIIKTITVKKDDSLELQIIDYETKDIMYDPKTINVNDFIDLINQVYGNKTHDAYVVFNKGYEITRMKEMIEYISKNELVTPDKLNETKYKLQKIQENTVDIMLAFKKDAIFLHALRGYYSIKKVEKYITKSHLQLKHLITPYSELEVKNGKMAMDNAILRYTEVIGDKEWELKSKKLKEYCHNDVLAMIMVFDFINKLLKDGVDNLDDKDIDIFN